MASKNFTARSVATESELGMHADRGCPGLYLQITRGVAGLARSFKFRYVSPLTGKRRDMGLGAVAAVTLREARDAAEQCRALLRQGLDPIEQQRAARAARTHEANNVVTFDEAARHCIEVRRPEWTNKKHADQWSNTLSTYASPILGKVSVAAIDTALVQQTLAPIWTAKTETATRVRQRIEAVLDWAIAAGFRTGPNPASANGNLAQLLPKASKVRRVKHHPAVPYPEMYRFVQALRSKPVVSARALEFLILTAARTTEVVEARWDEFDLAAAVWSVPARRMKSRRQHRVPLSPCAIQILNAQHSNRQNDFVFPGYSKQGPRPLSRAAMLELMRDMDGYSQYVPHGFRSSFRDWASEATGFSSETIEMALAHTIKDQTEAAYRRGDQFQKRIKLMTAWATYTDTAPRSSVIPIRQVV